MPPNMTYADLVNAVFEFGGACLLVLNVQQLWRDRRLAGVRLAPTVWFNVWGGWNLYFYLHIGQVASWLAGMAVFVVNTIWVSMALYFWLSEPKASLPRDAR